MSNFDELIAEIAVRFDLGPKARLIVIELVGFVAKQPGGIDGFLDDIQRASLAEKIASWFGSSHPWPLTSREVKNALGTEFIERLAKKTRLTEGDVTKIIRDAIPKLIVCLDAECPVPVAAPAKLRFPDPEFSSAPPQFETLTFWRTQMPKFATGGNTPAVSLVVPAVAMLVTLGLFWHSITAGSANDLFVFKPAAETALVQTEPPMAIARSAENLDASFLVTAGWIENLGALVGRSNGQGVPVRAAHGDLYVEAAPAQTNLAWVIAPLPAVQLPQFLVAAETGKTPPKMKLALRGGEPSGLQNQAALDFPTIVFPANSTAIPPRSIPALRRAAIQIKQLPSGTLVQLRGYTHGTRTASDVKLSQQRANSVYRILVREGVSPAMLTAKGYGGAASLAEADRLGEGRSTSTTGGGQQADRRVEFWIISPGQ